MHPPQRQVSLAPTRNTAPGTSVSVAMSTNKLLHRVVVLITMVSPLAGQVAIPSTGPRGQLVDVGGYRLHLHCTGKGSPTVVFENGSADFSFVWDLVQPDVSKLTRAW